MQIETSSADVTIQLGISIGKQLRGGQVIALYGKLGSGKTTLTKGIAQGLGIAQTIVSPTFTILQTFPLLKHLHHARMFIHIDTYRTNSLAELRAIGIMDYLYNPETICVIEWPEIMSAVLSDAISIRMNMEQNMCSLDISSELASLLERS